MAPGTAGAWWGCQPWGSWQLTGGFLLPPGSNRGGRTTLCLALAGWCLGDRRTPGAGCNERCNQTFSPGTGAGAEHGGCLTSPRPQPGEKTSQTCLSETLPTAHWTDIRACGSGAEPVPPQRQLELGFPRAEGHLVPGKGGNHYKKRFRGCRCSCPEATALPLQRWGAGWHPLSRERCGARRLSPGKRGEGTWRG